MKRLFRIFELSKNEQRVVLILMFVLLAIAFVGYRSRVHRFQTHPRTNAEERPLPTAAEVEGN